MTVKQYVVLQDTATEREHCVRGELRLQLRQAAEVPGVGAHLGLAHVGAQGHEVVQVAVSASTATVSSHHFISIRMFCLTLSPGTRRPWPAPCPPLRLRAQTSRYSAANGV